MAFKYLKILAYLLVFGLFFIKGSLFLDPDLGWHLKMGEYILQNGIPKTDPFSYTMPSYPFIDHEWLTNVILAKLYPLIGQVGLSIIYALLATSALLIANTLKFKKIALTLLILAAVELFLYAGVRPQVESWFLFSILIYIVFNPKIWLKWKFWLPLLVLLWANLHGGFAIGIMVIILKVFLEIYESKKISLIDLGLLLAVFGVSLINPYGIKIWGEIWMQASDSSLRWSVDEWTPMLLRVDVVFWSLAVLSTVFLVQYRKKLTWFEKILYFGLLVATASSTRHAPFYILVALPLLGKILPWFYQDIKNNPYSLKIAQRFSMIFIICSLVLSVSTLVLLKSTIFSSNEDSLYPKQAINFLRLHSSTKNIFAPYGWGGYLIWKLPTKKVFIDGRMASWRGHHVLGESDYAFDDYRKVVYEEQSFEPLVNKYQIATVIWPINNEKLTIDSSNLPWWEKILNQSSPNFSQNLLQSGWKVIYRDNIAEIFQKPETKAK